MNTSRTDNSIRNMKFALAAQALNIVLSFTARKMFVLFLNEEYLGLGGLFSGVLSMLALAELGVGAAITFSLYRPIADGDESRTLSLLQLYRKAYFAIACAVAVLGVACTPILPYLIKDIPDIPRINTIYLLFVSNSALSYCFSARQALLIADQKRYIISLCSSLCTLFQHLLQIAILLLTKNYIAYLLVWLGCTLLNNIVLSIYVGRCYPYVRTKARRPLLQEDAAQIKRNIKAMIAHQLGTVVVFGTDSILISKLVSLAAVGLYSNYTLIVNTVKTMTAQVFQSVTASVGNLGASEDLEKLSEVFEHAYFFNAWIAAVCFSALLSLLNPFITVWLGARFCFSFSTVLLICLNFYFTIMRSAVQTFKEALGLYWYDRYKPLFESIINLVVSIWLGLRWGINGILMGTLASTLLTCFWIEPYVLFKHGLQKPSGSFCRICARYILTSAVTAAITYAVCSYLPSGGVRWLMVRFLVCALLPNGILFALLGKLPAFAFFVTLVRDRIHRS